MRRLRASVLCVDEGALLTVTLRDPVTGVVRPFLPGGKIESGETPSAAACRETLEETGYDVRIAAASELVAHYPFVWAGVTVDCTTHFFVAHLLSARAKPAVVIDVDYNLGTVWMPRGDISAAFGYHREILTAIEALLARCA